MSRNLLEYPIEPREVIEFLGEIVTLERLTAEVDAAIGGLGVQYAKTALAVVEAAAVIVKNGSEGSTSRELLEKAFRSQHIPVMAE